MEEVEEVERLFAESADPGFALGDCFAELANLGVLGGELVLEPLERSAELRQGGGEGVLAHGRARGSGV
jgi:hypothetical protein